MNILRQIAATMARGNISELNGMAVVEWLSHDVRSKYQLLVGDGKCVGGYPSIVASGSYSVPLPTEYSSTSRMLCIFASTGVARVSVVSPDHSNSTIILKGESSSRPGIVVWNGTITSITVANPGSSEIGVQYSLVELPDLTDVDSFRGGIYNYGSIT